MKKRKILEKALSGSKNIKFREMVALIEAFGFSLARVNGSHHIFTRPDINELVNIHAQQRQRQTLSSPSISIPYRRIQSHP